MDNRIEKVAKFSAVWQAPPDIDSPELLDWLFKYPVAKLAELGYMTRLQYSPLRDNETGELISDWTGYAEIYYLKYDRPLFQKRNFIAINKKPTEALLEAIIQVIDKEE